MSGPQHFVASMFTHMKNMCKYLCCPGITAFLIVNYCVLDHDTPQSSMRQKRNYESSDPIKKPTKFPTINSARKELYNQATGKHLPRHFLGPCFMRNLQANIPSCKDVLKTKCVCNG